MAVRYARSTDGSDADSGASWALAKATLTGVAAIDTAGDTIYVSQSHAESTASAVSLAWNGTQSSPTKLLGGNDAAEPPTALSTAPTVTTTGNSALAPNTGGSAYLYQYGINYVSGSGASGTASIALSGFVTSESCNFTVATTGTSSRIFVVSNGGARCVYKNCGFKFAASAQGLASNAAGSEARFIGGSLLSGGTSPADFIVAPLQGCRYYFDGFDFTNASTSFNLISDGAVSGIIAQFRDCKLPASWSGSLCNGTAADGGRYEMFNCDNGDTHYRYRKSSNCGTIQDETTLVRTGGASDGTTTYSLKLVANSNAEYPTLTLDTPEIAVYNGTVGSSMTATVEILHDSATALKDNEIWLEAMYLGTSGVPLASFTSDAAATVLTTAANQDSSSATWTTTGMTNANTQKLVCTFTPREEGYLHFVVKLAKASYTVYVDPKVTLA